MDEQFKGKVALITGSTSGIGLATVYAFAKRGINIILAGINTDTEVQHIFSKVGSWVSTEEHRTNHISEWSHTHVLMLERLKTNISFH